MDVEKVIEQLEKANKELVGTDNDVINGIDIGCVLDEAIQTIRELREQNKWHLCSEGLPGESDYYLTRIHDADVDDYDYRKTWFAHEDDYNGESEWRELQSYEEVIAWRELPKFEEV